MGRATQPRPTATEAETADESSKASRSKVSKTVPKAKGAESSKADHAPKQSTKTKDKHLGAYARKAIRKHLNKMSRYESVVLNDTDIENLHQMRIGLRRLRTTLQTFETVLDWPEAVRDQALKPLAKRLGRVRDLDVLLESLRDRHRPLLPKKERKALDQVLTKLQKRRDRQFKQMEQFLQSPQYTDIKENFRHWIKHPQAGVSAHLGISLSLPDLLLPVLSQTLLHPGWLATPAASAAGELAGDKVSSEVINQWLDDQGTILHDLRKQMKQLRYQADFFASHYDATYNARIKEFKTIQDLLGELQDYWVLRQILAKLEGASWQRSFPSLVEHIQQQRWEIWQQWEAIRRRYITQEVRSELRQMMLNPMP